MGLLQTLSDKLKNRSLTSRVLVQSYYDRIAASDDTIKAFISLQKEVALAYAEAVDAALDKGESLPTLAGIPIAVKDNINIRNTHTTCASRMLENYVSPYNATVIDKLYQHRMIPIGKTNLDEFAMGLSSENSAFFTTRNPWNTDYSPGGSSSGSAAAVAAHFAPAALGSDTGGSIRQPASFCSVTGIKPTYGRVSRFGLVAFASSLDQIGPLTQSVADGALVLNAICGHDPMDSTSSPQPVPDFTKFLGKDIKGLRIGVPSELVSDAVHPDVRQSVFLALDRLKTEGATYDLISIDALNYALSVYFILSRAEASANLARFDGVRYGYRAPGTKSLREMICKSRGMGFGSEVKRRIILGTYVLSAGYYEAYYLKALKARTYIQNAFQEAFQTYDLLVTPTTPTLPFKLGVSSHNSVDSYLADMAACPVNIAGLPAMSIPVGFSDGLPVGLQLIGKPFDEGTLLGVGDRFQALTDFHTQVAPTVCGVMP
ncbi:MAG: Asp-tRNA(Asn)/Glu-tRNA(Gln) amidotransferase subunit GatA [Candidatus Margulisiibacteriota bacterium]